MDRIGHSYGLFLYEEFDFTQIYGFQEIVAWGEEVTIKVTRFSYFLEGY
jgi:hypothetical protein